MSTHNNSNKYKEIAVQYYLVENKSQEDVCNIFNPFPRKKDTQNQEELFMSSHIKWAF